MSKVARICAWTMLFWLILFTPAIAETSHSSGSPVRDAAPPLKIGAGDLIEVTMFENADLSGRFRVDEDGEIDIPLIGRVHVEGLTAGGAAKVIEQRYVDAQILQPAESHATVFISEYASQGITVNGEVKSPGVYPALGVRTLNDVITAAGGLTVTADTKVIVSHRGSPEDQMTVDYDPEAHHPIVPNVQIFPGDTVMVPRAGIVYVLGDVGHSGGYVLESQRVLTVEKAIALAGGNARAASLKHVQLVRTLPDGRREAITIPLNLIYKGTAPDVALKDGDVVYVPTSKAIQAGEQALTAAVSIGTAFAVYKIAYQ